MITVLAILCCSILLALAVFQIALIAGAPIGKYAWGGSHKVLPVKLRIGSIISIFLYGLIALVVLSKSEIIPIFNNQPVIGIATWVIAGYFCLGVIMNAISRSRYERNLMTPVALVLAILCIIIATY